MTRHHCTDCGSPQHRTGECDQSPARIFIGCLWAIALESAAVIAAYHLIRLFR